MNHRSLGLVVHEDAQTRAVRETKLASHLKGILGDVEPDVLSDIAGCLKWIRIASGNELFAEGDAPDGAYVVVVGRLRVVIDDAGSSRVIDEVGPGGYVGEMALINRQPRSASVFAARDTELVWISNEAFDYIVDRHPRILLGTSRVLVDRLQRQMRGAPLTRKGARTFAIVPCRPEVDIRWFVDELTRHVGVHGTTVCIDGALARREVGDPKNVTSWLMSQEVAHDFVVYRGDTDQPDWTERAIRHADDVIFVGDGTASPELGEAELSLGRDRKLRPRTRLVLLQPDGKHAYEGTKQWLERRDVVTHHHVRRGRIADVARVARMLTGNAVGVVFGGGGSRGYGHIGVLRALEELGVPVDAAGGTSVGAVVAMAKALDLDARGILGLVPPLMRSAFFDPTLPLASLMRGEHALRGLRDNLGTIGMEDFVLPIFAVSTNLTRGEEVVHRHGSAATAIRASGSVPGIFPPVPWNGDLLVDGGLSNNVPVDVMAKYFAERIVAVDVIPDVDLRADGDLPAAMSGFGVAWRKLNPFAPPLAMPSILATLMRSATTSSRGLRKVDSARYPHLLYLKPSLRRWNLMDFSLAEPVEKEGYEESFAPIEAWWNEARRARGLETVDASG